LYEQTILRLHHDQLKSYCSQHWRYKQFKKVCLSAPREAYRWFYTQIQRIKKPVYYQIARNAFEAIAREKQLKGGSGAKKMELINSLIPDWLDLYDSL
jgi:hypothetical protein